MSVDVLVQRTDIAGRVAELGAALDERFEGVTPVFVGVLKGAFPFLADLVRAVSFDVEVDFIALTRFGAGGRVSLAHDTSTNLTGRHVVLVEDIVDTGLTLRSLLALLEAREPASITTVTLLDKATRRLVGVPVDHAGFVIGDEFVVGYGMDWEGQFRNLPDLWAVLDFASFAADPDSVRSRAHTDH